MYFCSIILQKYMYTSLWKKEIPACIQNNVIVHVTKVFV